MAAVCATGDTPRRAVRLALRPSPLALRGWAGPCTGRCAHTAPAQDPASARGAPHTEHRQWTAEWGARARRSPPPRRLFLRLPTLALRPLAREPSSRCQPARAAAAAVQGHVGEAGELYAGKRPSDRAAGPVGASAGARVARGGSGSSPPRPRGLPPPQSALKTSCANGRPLSLSNPPSRRSGRSSWSP